MKFDVRPFLNGAKLTLKNTAQKSWYSRALVE